MNNATHALPSKDPQCSKGECASSGTGMGTGLAIGVALGVLFDDLAFWMCMGIALGAAFDTPGMSGHGNKEEELSKSGDLA